MDDGSKQAKSTGYIPPIRTGKGSGSARRKSTGEKKVSPVLSNVPIRDASLSLPVAASHILAVQVILLDYKELKTQLPASWEASENGKIYWCASMPGHKLTLVNGVLYIDNIPASILLQKLLVNSTNTEAK